MKVRHDFKIKQETQDSTPSHVQTSTLGSISFVLTMVSGKRRI